MIYDVIGIIYTPGKYDEEGRELLAPIALEGFHVNVDEVPEDLLQYEVFPTSPMRQYAGGITHCLKFSSKEEWENYLEKEEPKHG